MGRRLVKDILDMLIEKAPALRKAGVARIECKDGDFSVDLHPHVDVEPPQRGRPQVVSEDDPLRDPWTYGEGGGSYVPTLRRGDAEEFDE